MGRNNHKRNNNMAPDNQQNNDQEQANNKHKRLVIVTGDKGGVGKSTFARGLLQLYIDKNLWCLGYDADQRNNQLYRHYNKYPGLVRFLDVFERGKTDKLLNDLEADYYPLVLIDMPAQSGGVFEKFVKELSVFDMLASELGYRVTMVSVINRLRDSVNILNALYERCSQDKVDYVVVKNLFFGDEDKFGRYNNSSIRKTLLEKGLIELSMPDLMDDSYDFVDYNNLTFKQATLKEVGAQIATRARVKSWLDDFGQKIQPAHDLLGFNCERLPDGACHVIKDEPDANKEQVPDAA